MPDYHAWTHRPKELGGTDPIELPPGATPMVEWISLSSTTNWGAGPTDLDFTAYSGAWDTDTPTFDVSGGNLLIEKGGAYEIGLAVISPENDGSGAVMTEVQTGIAIVSGEVPTARVHGFSALNAYYDMRLPYYLPITSGSVLSPVLHFRDIFGFNVDQFTEVGTSGPAEVQVNAVKYWDGVDTADTGVIVRLWCLRFGDKWED